MTTTLSSKGQIVLPAEFRREDAIAPGQIFEVERVDAGEYVLRRIQREPNTGLVDWLLACPARGFLTGQTPAIPSESTTDIRPDFP